MDPNTILPGNPNDRWVYLAPDWSSYKPESAAKPAAGHTRVRVRDIKFADGRVVTVVLNENGDPVGADGGPTTPAQARVLDQITDDDQVRRFESARTAATREQGQAERKVTRTYTGVDPNTGRPATVTEYESGPPKYDEIKPTAAQQGTKEWRTEGTPDGQGGFDNSKPTMAAYVDGKRTGETRAPNAKELEDWNLAGQMTRNPGGKTDEQIAADTKATADANKPPTPALTTRTINGRVYTTQTTPGVNGAAPTIVHFGPDGQPVPVLPDEAKETEKPDLVGKPTGNADEIVKDGRRIKRVEYVLPNGTKEWREQGAPDPGSKEGFAPEPDGLPALNPTATNQELIDGVYQYSTALSAQVKEYQASGGTRGISPDDATKLANRRADYVEATLTNRQQGATTSAGLRGQDISQRGQTLGDTQSRRATAVSVEQHANERFQNYLKYLSPGMGGTFLAARNDALANSRAHIDSYGGMRESPEIPVSEYPMLAAYRQQGQAGIQAAAQGAPAAPPMPAPAPAPAPALLPNGVSNTTDAGGVPRAYTPAAATTPSPVDVPVAENPVSGQPITMPPPVGSPVPPPVAAPAPAPAPAPVAAPMPAAPAAPMPAVPAPALPVRDDWNQPAPAPGAPVQMMPRFIQEARFGPGNFYDPNVQGAQLAQRLGIPPEIFQAAMGGLFR